MRKLFISLMCLFIVGCAGTTITPTPTNTALATAAGQIFGYKFAQNNPSLIPSALADWTVLASGASTQDIITLVIARFSKQASVDPLLTLEMTNIIQLVTINTTSPPIFDTVLIQDAAKGVVQGIQLYQSTVSTSGVEKAKLFH